MAGQVPVVDVGPAARVAVADWDAPEPAHATLSPLADVDYATLEASAAARAVADAVGAACREWGFFYIRGYPIPPALEATLDSVSRDFFHLPQATKDSVAMWRGGRAWRGYFPVGNELTSGKPDLKEGIYFGTELPADDPRVATEKLPLHGPNLFPNVPTGGKLKAAVLRYMQHCERVGQLLAALVAMSLGLPATTFRKTLCAEPLCLFRIFHYPGVALLPPRLRDPAFFGVGEHTDYGLLTVLKQDRVGGLEVKNLQGKWIPAPPIDGTLVVNIGDMLEAVTRGLYRSTPHRVQNPDPSSMRLSFPFFFDPGYHAVVKPLPLSPKLATEAAAATAARARAGYKRWDSAGASLAFDGTYGSYLVAKIGKVFPDLATDTGLPQPGAAAKL